MVSDFFWPIAWPRKVIVRPFFLPFFFLKTFMWQVYYLICRLKELRTEIPKESGNKIIFPKILPTNYHWVSHLFVQKCFSTVIYFFIRLNTEHTQFYLLWSLMNLKALISCETCITEIYMLLSYEYVFTCRNWSHEPCDGWGLIASVSSLQPGSYTHTFTQCVTLLQKHLFMHWEAGGLQKGGFIVIVV